MRDRSLAEYQKNFREKAGRKVFMPFDKYGEVDRDAVEATNLVERKLGKHPEFVGVTYHGSSALGYSEKGSDVDINVLYDLPDPKDTRDTFLRSIRGFRGSRIHGREIHLFGANVNVGHLARNFGRGSQDRWNACESIARLCKVGRGPKIRAYRQQVADWAETLDKDIQEELLEDVSGFISDWESERLGRIRIRTPKSGFVHDENTMAFLESRQRLWRERIAKLLNIRSS